MLELFEFVIHAIALLGEWNDPDESKRKMARIGCAVLAFFFILAMLIVMSIFWTDMGR